MSEQTPVRIVVDGIVAMRDREPYVRIFVDDKVIGQLTMSQARKVADDILLMASRTEADAMLIRFFDTQDFPEGAAVALMHEFRVYRLALDEDKPEGSYHDPDTGEQV